MTGKRIYSWEVYAPISSSQTGVNITGGAGGEDRRRGWCKVAGNAVFDGEYAV